MAVKLQGIDLPSDLLWEDEFRGFGVGQQIRPLLTGHLLIEETAQPEGKPITLVSGDGSWVTLATVQALDALVSTPLTDGQTLTLEWGDTSYDVAFDRSRGPGFSARQVRRLASSAQPPDHPYYISISLLIKGSS
ncbi:MAG: hypothetical protein AAGI11_15315 [Pseudomonadota bacterium]